MKDIKYFLTDECKLFTLTKAHETDAAFDIRCAEPIALSPNERVTVSTGLFIALPVDDADYIYEAQIRPRSGLASKYGITIVNTPGTIDAGYHGEIKVILLNTGIITTGFTKGDRVAQLVVNKIPKVSFKQVYSLADLGYSDRGIKGFGSSGVK